MAQDRVEWWTLVLPVLEFRILLSQIYLSEISRFFVTIHFVI
jgi:hypothetical protein